LATKIKIGLISLGCPKNLADLEGIVASLGKVEIVDIKNANVIFLNTCGFLKTARDEVFENINQLKNKKLIVTGCLAGQFTGDDFTKFKNVYAFVSEGFYQNIKEIFNQVAKGKKIYAVTKEPTKFQTQHGKTILTNGAYSYIKIAEGCNRMCSYCLIPNLKGDYRSREMKDILDEAKSLVLNGVKELILVAQDCGLYGIDLYKKKSLATLLKKLTKIKGDFWIRVLYIYPETVDKELLAVIGESKKICKYLDIPLQHGDAKILKAMNRPNDTEKVLKRIKEIRTKIPGITLRTSLITGFPGETKSAFKNLQKFVKKIDFDHAGVFEYSREKGTKSYELKGQIPAKTKSTRRKEIMLIQQKISSQKLAKFIGKTLNVLIESYDPKNKIYMGRSEGFAPEIDGTIFVKSSMLLTLPCFKQVKITSASEYDLFGIPS